MGLEHGVFLLLLTGHMGFTHSRAFGDGAFAKHRQDKTKYPTHTLLGGAAASTKEGRVQEHGDLASASLALHKRYAFHTFFLAPRMKS